MTTSNTSNDTRGTVKDFGESINGFCDCDAKGTDKVNRADSHQVDCVVTQLLAEGAPAIAKMTAAQVDEILSHHYTEISRRSAQIQDIKDSIKYARTYKMSEGRIERYQAQIDQLQDIVDKARFNALPFDEDYAARRWNRYFLVSGGHVHRGTNCSSCYITTQYTWLINLADCEELDMVNEYGDLACTVCFPNAPTMPAFMKSVADREAEEAAKAEALCPSSGHYQGKGFWDESRQMFRSNFCPGCGLFTRPTRNGNVRKHNRPA